MTRNELPTGTTIKSNFLYTIDGVAGDGASCVVYNAHYTDRSEHRVLIKECYPYFSKVHREGSELVWEDGAERTRDVARFYSAYDSLMSFQNKESTKNNTAPVFSTFEANGTCYTVTLLEGGRTFDTVHSNSLEELLKIVQSLAKAVKRLHEAGFLHLDIKPSNFLVLDGTKDIVRLFDFDTVIPVAELQSGRIKTLSYSQGWAAPEQYRGDSSKIGFATDIYAVGAVLFEKIMGRLPDNTDRGMFSDWELDGKLFDRLFPGTGRLVKEIFKKTLSVNPSRRFQSTDELIDALDRAIKASRREQFIVSYCPSCTADFIGREKELAEIQAKLEQGCNTVFLHGDGGVGKSELSKKYAELHRTDYDAVFFFEYDESKENALAKFADEITLTNDEAGSDRMKALSTICKDSKVLFIIDNFDVKVEDFDAQFEECAKKVLGLDADYIVSTRTMVGSLLGTAKSTVLELDTLSTEELVALFKKEYGRATTESEEDAIQDIIESFDNWTLVVPLIAKSLIASGTEIEAFAEQLNRDGFKSLDDSEEIILLKDGKAIKKDPVSMLRYVFDFSTILDSQLTVLRNIYCLRYLRQLSKAAYKKYTCSKNLNQLNNLIYLNWVKYDHENDEISVHKAIEELIEADLEITCETVPGIYNYIKTVTESLKKCEHAEDAKALTFAMLVYTDLYDSDAEAGDIMRPVLEYVLRFFCEDMETVYRILCDYPVESTWHMHASWYDEAVSEILYSATKETDCTSIGSDDDDKGAPSAIVSWFTCVNCARSVFCYFSYLQGKGEHFAFFLKLAESEDENTVEVDDEISDCDLINVILAKYQYAQFHHASYSPKGLPIKKGKYCLKLSVETAGIYLRIMHALQTVLKHSQGEDFEQIFNSFTEEYHFPDYLQHITEDELYSMLQNCIINLESSVGRFVFYGMAEEEILSYEIPEYDDYRATIDVYKKLHWSKKAKLWYKSVDDALTKCENPEPIYRALLSWKIQIEAFSQSKVKELVNYGLIWRFINDERISDAVKRDFLHCYIPEQVVSLQKEFCTSWKRTRRLSKYNNTLQLYNQALTFLEPLYAEKVDEKITVREINIYRAIFIIRKAIKLQAFDPMPRVLSAITVENAKYLCELLELANYTQWSGYIKKSQEMKNKILDVFFALPEGMDNKLFQRLYFRLEPLAEHYGRAEELISMQEHESPRTLHCIDLLYSDEFNEYEKKRIYNRVIDSFLLVAGIVGHFSVSEGPERSFSHELEDCVLEVTKAYIKYEIGTVFDPEFNDGVMYMASNGDSTIGNYVFFQDVIEWHLNSDSSSVNCEWAEGLYYYVLETADNEVWKWMNSNPDFFLDLSMSKAYAVGRIEGFKEKLLQIRPDKKEMIEFLLRPEITRYNMQRLQDGLQQ